MEEKFKVKNKDQSVLSKREYFSAKAMQGILSSRELQEALNQDRIAWEDFAVQYADKLLRALETRISGDRCSFEVDEEKS